MDSQSERTAVSVWDYKPWWCQPWSILLTGIALIGGSWFLFKTLWISLLIAAPVLVWMGFFLLLYPRLALENGLLNAHTQGLADRDLEDSASEDRLGDLEVRN